MSYISRELLDYLSYIYVYSLPKTHPDVSLLLFTHCLLTYPFLPRLVTLHWHAMACLYQVLYTGPDSGSLIASLSQSIRRGWHASWPW